MNILNLFKIFFLLIVLTFSFSAYAKVVRKSDPLKHLKIYQPARLPDVPFWGKPGDEDTAGGEEYSRHKFEDFRGKFVILNFWATWCTPCRLEMPSLSVLQKEMSEEYEIQVIAVSEDFTGMPTVEAFYKDTGIENLDDYIDLNNSLMGAFKITSLPTTVFIDKSGKEVGRVQGAVNWSAKEVRSFIKSLL